MMKKTFFSFLLLLISLYSYSQLNFLDVSINHDNQQDGLIQINWTLSSLTEEWDSILVSRNVEDEAFRLRANIPYDGISYVDDSLCGVNVVYKLYLYQDGAAVDSVTTQTYFEDDARPEPTVLYNLNYQNDSITLDW